jgi:anti-sigma regulatory factor (Ser/Thr protein kinase)
MTSSLVSNFIEHANKKNVKKNVVIARETKKICEGDRTTDPLKKGGMDPVLKNGIRFNMYAFLKYL